MERESEESASVRVLQSAAALLASAEDGVIGVFCLADALTSDALSRGAFVEEVGRSALTEACGAR